MAHLTSTLLPERGFHPVSRNAIRLSGPSQIYESCTAHLYFTLPPVLFVDTHELAQRESSYSFNHWGTRDLERPVHALPDEVSDLLINAKVSEGLELGSEEEEGKTLYIEVPMHLRYGKPKRPTNGGKQSKPYELLRVEWPQAFLHCPSSFQIDHLPSLPSLPAHILSALPSSKSGNILIPIPPHANFSSETHNTLILPLGTLDDLSFVEPITALTILACFLWLLRVSWKIATRLNVNSQRPKTA
ncbi:PIG-X [Flammula alnicola]|nr:PIG-X [Flammula alnicola]